MTQGHFRIILVLTLGHFTNPHDSFADSSAPSPSGAPEVTGLTWRSASRLSAYLDLPPAIAKSIGNPVVDSTTKGPRAIELNTRGVSGINQRHLPNHTDRIRRIKTTGYRTRESGETAPRLKADLSRAVLNHFWTVCFSNRDNRLEGIPLDQQKFVQIGMAKLTSAGPPPSSLESSWWKVRMGLPQKMDSDFHLLSTVATYAEGFVIYGHYTFGLRRIGGDPEHDIAIDPRAPWESDDPPTYKDWKNPENSLVCGLHSRPLYDWLYTQTHMRGLNVEINFITASKEQVQLLQALIHRPGITEIAPFKTFRYNCATLGQLFFEGLLPAGEKVCLPHPLADIPDRIARKINRRFDVVKTVELVSHPDPDGEPRTASWKVHPAPDRKKTPEFLALKEVAELN